MFCFVRNQALLAVTEILSIDKNAGVLESVCIQVRCSSFFESPVLQVSRRLSVRSVEIKKTVQVSSFDVLAHKAFRARISQVI